MRILIANDGVDHAGGVNTYLHAVCAALEARGHAVAWIHCGSDPAAGSVPADACWSVPTIGIERALASASSWRPDVCFSHNVAALDLERGLLSLAPVVKMMHGFFGTCVSGLKSFGWPVRHPCSRVLGPACLAYFLPRRCGTLHPLGMIEQYRFAVDQRSLFSRYRAIVVASEYMRDEYVRGGAPRASVHAIPLFAPAVDRPLVQPSTERAVVFLGRMTPLKGGDLLVRAVAEAQEQLNRPVPLVMAGDGPERARWASLAQHFSIDAEFPGWIHQDEQSALFARASLLVVPSTWPEPFGLVGLEAAASGIPSVAFDVGGIREWLVDGDSGLLAGGVPEPVALGAAIVRVLSDRALHARLAAGALRMARSLSIDRHVGALERVLEMSSITASAQA